MTARNLEGGHRLPTVRSATTIAAQLRRGIFDGVYLYGERLPAERQLAQAFGSSRTTVREALSILQQSELVTRRLGSGTFVAFRAASLDDDVAEITSPLELIEVRIAVEPHMVRLATINATPRDLQRLADTMRLLEGAGADADAFTRWDRQFHEQIAEATHNPLMVALYRQISHVRGHRQWNAMKDKILTAERIADYNDEHRALYAALQRRDAEAAQVIVGRHLERARRHLVTG